jgi:soluble lytic murein transglycosylase-like protein
MWWLFLILLQSPQEQAAGVRAQGVRAQMEASISAQRDVARKQSESARAASPRPAPMLVSSIQPGGRWVPQSSLMVREQPACDPLAAPELTGLVNSAAQAENLNPLLVREVARQESGFRPCAVSSQGAMGLMQLMPVTQIELGVIDPWDPRQSIEAGSRLLRQLLDRYHGDMSLALGAYNAGPERVDQTGGVPAIPETRNYVDSILYRFVAGGLAGGP